VGAFISSKENTILSDSEKSAFPRSQKSEELLEARLVVPSPVALAEIALKIYGHLF
jgi:hypothetical protein